MIWGPNTEQDTREFIRRVQTGKTALPRLTYDLVLVKRADYQLIGACGLYIRNAANKEGEIGYVLNRRFWNQGFVTEAAQRLVSFGFEALGLHRIYATCDPSNTGSYRVMEKTDMQREGRLRSHRLMKGTWRDSLVYSILENEYFTRKERQQKKSLNASPLKIEYREINSNALDLIGLLWEKQREHHRAIANYFPDHFTQITFEVRKKQLLEKGQLYIDLVRDPAAGGYVGYCVTSLTAAKMGEIESIYIEPGYRRSGIGDRLMTRALAWLEANSAGRRVLAVGEGNESVFAFYRHYRFYPRTTVLEQKTEIKLKGDS
jgi:RimJ/RimL family protein N-acetyltransferase